MQLGLIAHTFTKRKPLMCYLWLLGLMTDTFPPTNTDVSVDGKIKCK